MAQQSRLLTIAPEIRNQIYELSLPSNGKVYFLPLKGKVELPGITQVCQQTRAESVPMLLRNMTIALGRFPSNLKQQGRSHLLCATNSKPAVRHLSNMVPGALKHFGTALFSAKVYSGQADSGNAGMVSYVFKVNFATRVVKATYVDIGPDEEPFTCEELQKMVAGVLDGMRLDGEDVASLEEFCDAVDLLFCELRVDGREGTKASKEGA